MDEKRFWDIIAFACKPAQEIEWEERLIEALKPLPLGDLVSFHHRLFDQSNALVTPSHQVAAGLITGWIKLDDPDAEYDFDMLRCWVIGLGKERYEAIRANADNLADHVPFGQEELCQQAELFDAPSTAWKRLGRSREDYDAAFEERGGVVEPVGEDWDIGDRDEARRRLPRLAALYEFGFIAIYEPDDEP